MLTWTEMYNGGNYDGIMEMIKSELFKQVKTRFRAITETMRAKILHNLQDIMQDCFLACMEGTEEDAQQRINRAANRTIVRYIRHEYPNNKAISLDAETEDGGTVADTIGTDGKQAESELVTAIHQAIKKAAETEADKKALYALIFKGYTIREAASTAGLTKRRIETLKERIKKELQ